MTSRPLGAGLLLLFGALLLQACGDSTSAPVPTRLVVTPNTATLNAVGATQQYSARVEDKKGAPITGDPVTWSSSRPDVVSVDALGLARAEKAGTATITATAAGISGNASLSVVQLLQEIQKSSGDAQTGAMRETLPQQPQVQLLDSNGNPIPGVSVLFSVVAGGGTVSAAAVTTGPDGRASTSWTLGCSNDNPQRLNASAAGLSATFTATADLSLPAICQTSIPEGRATLPYGTTLEVAGGDPATMVWSVTSGTLPQGITLGTGGALTGTPTQSGLFSFRARAQDAQGMGASADFDLRVCPAPITLTAGGSQAVGPTGPDGCGFFLPAGADGDRYRFAVVSTFSGVDSTFVPSANVSLSKITAGGAVAEPGPVSSASDAATPTAADLLRSFPEPLRVGVELARTTEEFHQRLRMAERELLRSLGPAARLVLRERALLASSPAAPAASPDKMSFTHPSEYNDCALGSTVRAVKIAENDLMVIYQDSTQNATSPVSPTHATWMLDYYRDYGKPVIDSYFGGTTDLNGDGKIAVLVTPEVESGTAAFVWSGDFFPRTAQGGFPGCAASNTMELVRFSQSVIAGMGGTSPNFQALATLVHEVKHVSSLFKSIVRGAYQPLWVEEGTAEIAGELSSRLAWEAAGGPSVGAMATRADVSAISRENYGVILRLARTVGYMTSHPNGVVVTPLGASSSHSVYGSGWHFHRWLGDSFGNASTRLADASFFRLLNDSTTAPGVVGIESAGTGSSWGTLMEEYAAAVMLNGTGAPQPLHPFSTYDFPDIVRSFTYTGKPLGTYPWPVNVSGDQGTATFSTASYSGTLGASGMQIYDVTSDGTGLGLDVKVQSSSPLVRIVVVRIQ